MPAMNAKVLANSGLLRAVTCAIVLLIVIEPGPGLARQLPMQPIVNGHPVPPRDDQLRGIGQADVTDKQAAEIDDLYRELMQDYGNDPRSASPRASASSSPDVQRPVTPPRGRRRVSSTGSD